MKKVLSFLNRGHSKKTLIAVMVIFSSFCIFAAKAAAQDVAVSYKEFYESLSPYGQWIEDSTYGYGWVPNVDEDFQPYWTDGYWVMTDYGNTWVSDYAWGWACFHYGRWTYTSYYGWVWIPGYEWGPGWVAWRWGMGYCGWAPLYPEFDQGIGVTFSCPDDWWIFMHPHQLYNTQYASIWRGYMRGPRHTRELIEHTRLVTSSFTVNGISYYAGPRPAQIEQVIHKPVPVYHITYSSVRGPEQVRNNVVYLYRPARFDRLPSDSHRPRPSNAIHAPVRINTPEEIRTRRTQPREFKANLQRRLPEWVHPVPQHAPGFNRQHQ